jgi:epoxide hydrolase-like predicted phosphatase
MIKAVVFDLDGVYFTADSFKNFKANLPKSVTDQEKVDLVLAKSNEILNFKKGLMSETEYWDYVRQNLGITIGNDEISQILRDSYQVDEQVRNVVKKVRSLGIKTCICSNQNIFRSRELNNQFHFWDDFDVRVFSYDVGFVKPDSGIYQELIKQSGCLPSEIVYTDDKEANVKSAKDLGINSFVYIDFPTFLSQLRNLGLDI